MRQFVLRLPTWVLVLSAVVGCGTATFIVQQYDGEPRPAASIAQLRVRGGAGIRLEALDGEQLRYQLDDKDARVQIEMLPGVHELELSNSQTQIPQQLRFLAKAGHVYRPEFVSNVALPNLPTTEFVLLDVDVDSDAPLALVLPAPVAHPRPTPAPSLAPTAVNANNAAAPDASSALPLGSGGPAPSSSVTATEPSSAATVAIQPPPGASASSAPSALVSSTSAAASATMQPAASSAPASAGSAR